MFYVLFEAAGKPAFMVDEDETPTKFKTTLEAAKAGAGSRLGRAFGYAVMEWPDGLPELARIVSTHPA